jgi:hypothetical protein
MFLNRADPGDEMARVRAIRSNTPKVPCLQALSFSATVRPRTRNTTKIATKMTFAISGGTGCHVGEAKKAAITEIKKKITAHLNILAS